MVTAPGNLLFQLSRTLDVDVEYQAFPAGAGLVQFAAVGPVIVAKYLSRFEKLVAGQHRLELLPGDEMITLAVLFLSREACGWYKTR